MTNYREILRLSSLQYSQRTIESMAHCSRHTVRMYCRQQRNKAYPGPYSDDVANADLEKQLLSEQAQSIQSIC